MADLLLERWPLAPLHAVEGAYLHDSIEDGRATYESLLAAGVSPGGAGIARLLDRGNPAHGGGPTYAGYVRSLCGSGDLWAVRVKLCDNLHNSLESRRIPGSDAAEKRYAPARAALEAAEAEMATKERENG